MGFQTVCQNNCQSVSVYIFRAYARPHVSNGARTNAGAHARLDVRIVVRGHAKTDARFPDVTFRAYGRPYVKTNVKKGAGQEHAMPKQTSD